MTDTREKLFALFQDCDNPAWKWFPNNAEMLKLIDYLINNGVTVLEQDEKTVVLPMHGSMLKATFDSKGVIGTLQINKETYQVYLGDMEAHQLGSIRESYSGKPCITPGSIKRKFTLIEV